MHFYEVEQPDAFNRELQQFVNLNESYEKPLDE